MGPGKTWNLVSALGVTCCATRSQSPDSFKILVFCGSNGSSTCPPGTVLQGRGIFDTLCLGHALQTRFSCLRGRNSPSHPGHLHRGYAAGRLRVVAPCWRTGLRGTRESLEDKRTRQVVISGPRDGLTSGVGVPRGTVELARLWTALGGGWPVTAPESTARLRSSENMAEY